MIGSDLGVVTTSVTMIITGVLMLASVVRGVPRPATVSPAQGDVILVATKSEKKSKGAS